MGYIIIFLWLVILPVFAGGICTAFEKENSISALWLKGQFLLWAVFQAVAVPFILQERNLSELMLVYMAVSLLLGAAGGCFLLAKRKHVHKCTISAIRLWTKPQKILAAAFILLWLIQMCMLFILAVNDGDDAFYMAVANISRVGGSMYTTIPYSYGSAELNYRYALAPFPVWIACLSRLSGVHTLILGHILLGILCITMSYLIYYEMGKTLFAQHRTGLLLFMFFIAILYLWGNTSSHTPESFLILRSRQGKALVAGVVFPALVCLLAKIGHRLDRKERVGFGYYFTGMTVLLTGCLGSTLGGALILLLWGSSLFIFSLSYRKISVLLGGALSGAPVLLYIMLYLTH